MAWTPQKKLEPKHKDKTYIVSPWLLTWQDDNYYLVAYDELSSEMKHYRVDKIRNAAISDRTREGKEVYEALDIARFSSKNFGMYHGIDEVVTLSMPTYLSGVIIDRFGTDTPIKYLGGEKFSARINVCVSQQFFGWVFGLGKDVTIEGPEHVKNEYKAFLLGALKEYDLS